MAAGRRAGLKRAISRMVPSVRSYAVWGAAALCAGAASVLAAPGAPGVLGGALALVMIAIAAIDARRFLIPDQLVLVGLLLGLAAAAMDRAAPLPTALAVSALRGLVLALAFFVFRAAYRHIRGRDGIGLGDVKLAAVAGVWLAWTAIAVAIDIAALSALAIVLVQAARGERISGTTAIPFGLFLAPAIWIAWLFEVISARLTG
jgi:leader peptidase (prepilin peptidase)/N-methyltransferase